MWYKLKRIMIRPNGVEKQVRPSGWTPWTNTIAYYPFENNTLDETWHTTIGSWSLTQDGLWYRPTSSAVISIAGYNAYYVNLWICIKSYTWNTYIGLGNDQRWCWYYVKHASASLNRYIYVFTNTSYNIGWSAYFSPTVNTWHNISYWYDWTKVIYSIDWVTNTLYNWAWYNFSNNLFLDAGDYIVSRYIVENKARTADEILAYYSKTKWNYWL